MLSDPGVSSRPARFGPGQPETLTHCCGAAPSVVRQGGRGRACRGGWCFRRSVGQPRMGSGRGVGSADPTYGWGRMCRSEAGLTEDVGRGDPTLRWLGGSLAIPPEDRVLTRAALFRTLGAEAGAAFRRPGQSPAATFGRPGQRPAATFGRPIPFGCAQGRRGSAATFGRAGGVKPSLALRALFGRSGCAYGTQERIRT